MRGKPLIFIFLLAAVALAASMVRSFHRLDYVYYTTAGNRSLGFVLAKGIVQFDVIDNGDVRPRNKGAWDVGSVDPYGTDWSSIFMASCAPAGPAFVMPQRRFAWIVPYDHGTRILTTDTWRAEAPPVDPVVRWIVLPYWLLIAATAAIPVGWLCKRGWKILWTAPGHCCVCGYDLRATPGRCPECGTRARSARPGINGSNRFPKYWKWIGPMVLIAAIASAVAWPARRIKTAALECRAPRHAKIVGRLDGCSGNLVRFSPDGTMLLTADTHHARVWDAITLKPITGPLPNEAAWTGGFEQTPAFSADGRRILTAARHRVRLIDVKTGRPLREFPDAGPRGAAAAMTSDASLVATASGGFENGNVIVWDAKSGRRLCQFPYHHPLAHVVFSPDKTDLLVAEKREFDQVYHVWNVHTGKELFPPITPESEDDAEAVPGWLPVSFSPDGTELLVDNGRSFTVYDARTRKIISRSTAGDNWGSMFFRLRFTPDGNRIVGDCSGAYVQAWDPLTGRPLGKSILIRAYSPVCSPDGNFVACAYAAGGEGAILDLRTDARILDFSSEDNCTFAFSPDGTRIAAAVGGGHTTIWKLSR